MLHYSVIGFKESPRCGLRNISVRNPSTSPLAQTAWHLSYVSSTFCTCVRKELMHLGERWTGNFLGVALLKLHLVFNNHVEKTYWGTYAVAAVSSYFVSNSRIKLRSLPVLEIRDSMNFFKASRVCQDRGDGKSVMIQCLVWLLFPT